MLRSQEEQGAGVKRWHGMVRRGLVAIMLLSAAAWMPAYAYTSAVKSIPEKAPDRWRIDIGGYAADAFTSASLANADTGFGVAVNFEDTFNMPSKRNVLKAAASWRMAARQYLDFGYVALNRTGENVIDQDITWGDNIIEAGGSVSTQFRTSFPYAAWRYDFLQVDKVRISGSAGFSYLGVKSNLAATGNITDLDHNPVSGSLQRTFDINFPVPLMGLQLDWALTRTLALRMYSRFIYVDYSGFKGGIYERAIRMYWYPMRHVGFAAGLEQESIDIKQYENGDSKLRLRYEITGLAAYVSFAF